MASKKKMSAVEKVAEKIIVSVCEKEKCRYYGDPCKCESACGARWAASSLAVYDARKARGRREEPMTSKREEERESREIDAVTTGLDWLVDYWTSRKNDPSCEVMGDCVYQSRSLLHLRRAVLAARKERGKKGSAK